MLVHGRYSYRRFGTLCCFMFFKNIALVMALYWYALAAAGSAIQVLPLFFVTCNPYPNPNPNPSSGQVDGVKDRLRGAPGTKVATSFSP